MRFSTILIPTLFCVLASAQTQQPPKVNPLSVAKPAPPAKPKMTPPPPTAPRPYEFPKVASKTLPNGLKVFVVEDHRLPLVSASLQILAGGAYAAPDKAGLANMTASLLHEGTTHHSAQELAKLADNVGGSLSAGAGDDVTTIGMTFMKSYSTLGMELMADMTRNPAFDQEEIDRAMRQAQSNLQVSYSSAEYLAPASASRALLGTHPYAYPGDGTPQTLRNIKRDDIVAFYKANYAPGRAWMAVAGDVTPDEAFALVEKYFGSWDAKAAPDAKLPAPPEPKPQVLIVDMPNAVQTQIIVGHLGVPRNSPDYLALYVANQIFGGSFNSRLNMKLRANEGLTYGASSSFDPARQTGTFQASTFTRTEKTADAIRMLVDLLKEFKKDPASPAEFDEAKSFLMGSFAVGIESAAAVASRVLTTAVYGLPEDYYPKYRQRLQALTREQMSSALQKFLEVDKLTIVAVGNAKEFSKALEAYGPIRIIKAEDLDLVAPDMVKVKAAAVASPESAAKGKKLIADALTALGGQEKASAVKDQVLTGKIKLSMPQASFDGDSEESVLYPSHYKMVMKLPVGVITESVDGANAWAAQGPQAQDLPPNLAAELRKGIQAAGGGMGLLLAAAAGQAEVQAINETTLNWKKGDFEAKLTFDPASHQLVKMAYSSIGMSGPAEMEVQLSDFRPVEGLTLPFHEVTLQNGQKVLDRTISERKLNTGVKPESFKKP
ncbi:pitrilysin family protein [uncultured Paludibaculum sp.]|uniref:M16 family metallopeptidase n=1 Tax=uncultured Paludibaculum sp. TaxID=1765020 RepID=UPI002AABF729|nr:pitrilysin family protein [uncultured Paludibaculum sp.]